MIHMQCDMTFVGPFSEQEEVWSPGMTDSVPIIPDFAREIEIEIQVSTRTVAYAWHEFFKALLPGRETIFVHENKTLNPRQAGFGFDMRTFRRVGGVGNRGTK